MSVARRGGGAPPTRRWPPTRSTSPGPGASTGRVEDDARRFVLEAVYEGYLMHYGTPRAFAGMDEDLRLLAGDALYALGPGAAGRRGRRARPWRSCPT